MQNSEVSLEHHARSSAQLTSDLSGAKKQQNKLNLFKVQIVTQIKETQQNQPMFTIYGFSNWRRGNPEVLNWPVTHMVNLISITTFVYITEKHKSVMTYSNSFENKMVTVIFLFAFWIRFFEFDDDQNEFDDDLDLFTPTQNLNRRWLKWNWLQLFGWCKRGIVQGRRVRIIKLSENWFLDRCS